MSENKQVRAVIKGRVQGVFYRASTKDAADDLGIKGWVRNLPDGSVEALFQGTPDTVSRMLDWCWQGPPASTVDDVIIEHHDMTENFTTFNVRY